MSYMLPHLHNGWQVDQAILSEEDRALVIRFEAHWLELKLLGGWLTWGKMNKHIMIDLGTGNNNKINWTMEDKQEMIDIVETVYRGARKGRGLVVSPKDYSTKYRY
ncbi:thioredoxin-like protein 4A isoform X1 [Oncorhynchus tshawytscha]|uniref:thioredoxin-like protein 4A isoform X1 n=1 Tax=Oncorhynchus tshawytscha TaxID=74940 RepID=UPI001C3C61EA|nr:thioredoxin-like protein 4A isoform X1 [Oncorhynchus tshawytscha]XP_042166378.1 thioredoxin-like protein 4A isoform X1 [Oncorhynchus tshawytscha]XP_042166379.1 thioredoxin-like protein 4A isoform X1 [Oncorhynchus tshawytscha]XP_042166380.1 thioredoxin-like protein 4A isoform X1 [Oncorhynchus tshawytscha]